MRRRKLSFSIFVGLGSLAVIAGGLSGCSTFFAVKEQQRMAGQAAVVSGTVETDYEARGPLIVALVARDSGGIRLVDYFSTSKDGPWLFVVSAGTYWIAAFEDEDADGTYSNEPALAVDWERPLDLAEGQDVKDIVLRIPHDGRLKQTGFSIRDLVRRDQEEQARLSLYAISAVGDVTTLEDPRFSREEASEGMWRYYDFLLENRPGIYFLQEYDPSKTPVLFVHGIGGTPIEFGSIISSLDAARFQPWVCYYPSGGSLNGIAEWLTQVFTRIRIEYDVGEVIVVAHSMGGLVTREFLLSDFERNGDTAVTTYVTISSPLGGMASAGQGVEHSPIVVNSWRGLAPGSEFLDGLFYVDPETKSVRRRLPDHMTYHMLFGFAGNSGDGVVALSSQLRPEAQEEARSVRGFEETHAGILTSPAAIARLNEIFDQH